VCTFIASKRYYFGTGGGSGAFADTLRHDGEFDVSVAWQTEDGVSSIREILCARWRQ